MATSKKIILKSSGGETFEVDEAVAMKSLTIKHMIEDDCANEAIPLDNVTGAILAKVIEYLKKHIDDADPNNKDESLMKWDEEFVKVDQPTLFSLIMAANFLHISELLDLTCNAVADMMRGKTPEQVRAIFNIKNDYTTKEEAEVREENKWAFE